MTESNPNQTQDLQLDIQAEIEKARSQEREKLHADISKLKTDVLEKAKVCNENYVTISNLRKELAEKNEQISKFEAQLEKAKEDGKVESKKDLDALTKELEEYKNKLALAEKEFADYKEAEKLASYLNDKVKDIDEEFKALVKGNNQEEINASYEQVKKLQDAVKQKYSTGKSVPLPNPKSKGAKAPVSLEELKAKFNEMSYDEYKEKRKKNFK